MKEEIGVIKTLLENYMNCDLENLPNEMFMSETVMWSGPKWNAYRNCLSRYLLRNTSKNVNKRAIKFNLELQYMRCLKRLPHTCTQEAGVALENKCHLYKYQAERFAGYASIWDFLGVVNPVEHHDTHRWYMQRVFTEYTKCIHSANIESGLKHCLPLATQQCKSSSIIATKLLRLNVDDLKIILKEHPPWKLVHQIRDPRAVLISQRESHIKSTNANGSITVESRVVCDKMLNDARSLKLMEQNNPNQTLLMKYEDYADAPIPTARKIYSHMGLSLDQTVISAITSLTNAKNDSGAMYQLRINSSATARKWMTKITRFEKGQIDQIRAMMYEVCRYPTDVSLINGNKFVPN